MNIYRLFLTIIVLLGCSCSGELSFEMPDIQQKGLSIPADQIITIPALKMAWEQQNNNDLYPFLRLSEGYDDKYLEGYVISNDQWGNFYKTLIVQDDPGLPAAGLKILLDQTNISQRFDVGRRILIKLSGLTVGLNSGVLTLGLEDGGALSALPKNDFMPLILRDTIVVPIVPRQISLDHLGPQHTNLWMKLEDVQFHRFQCNIAPPMTFAADPADLYDGERWLQQCDSEQYLILKTSTYADFSTNNLPSEVFTIQGVVQFDYFGDYLVLSVNEPSDLMINDNLRCDPVVLDCGEVDASYPIIWGQSFNQIDNLEALLALGWSAPPTNDPEVYWTIGNYGGNKYLQVVGEQAETELYESWLISPALVSPAGANLSLECDVQVNFQSGVPLRLWITEQNPHDATVPVNWQLLNYFIPNGPAEGFGDFKTIGPIDLSCISGTTFYLAFQYLQNTVHDDTRYHIDNIRIRSQ